MTVPGTPKLKGPNTLRVAVCAVALSLALGACSGGGGGGTTNTAKFCSDMKSLIGQIDAATGGGAPPAKSQLTSLAGQLRNVANEAPSEVKAHVSTEAAFFDKAAQNGISAVDANTTSAASDAGDRVSAYADKNCGSIGS